MFGSVILYYEILKINTLSAFYVFDLFFVFTVFISIIYVLLSHEKPPGRVSHLFICVIGINFYKIKICNPFLNGSDQVAD